MKSSVEIASSLELAGAEAASDDHGHAYKELMATYVAWGELLEAWNRGELQMSNEEFEEQCFEHLHRSQVMGMACDGYNAQRWAVLFNAITTSEVA